MAAEEAGEKERGLVRDDTGALASMKPADGCFCAMSRVAVIDDGAADDDDLSCLIHICNSHSKQVCPK